jgi:hypothetical protein
MANTYTLIEAQTLTSNQSSIEFTSVFLQTFTDLKVKLSLRAARSASTRDYIHYYQF